MEAAGEVWLRLAFPERPCRSNIETGKGVADTYQLDFVEGLWQDVMVSRTWSQTRIIAARAASRQAQENSMRGQQDSGYSRNPGLDQANEEERPR